jgi:hypothetical protein
MTATTNEMARQPSVNWIGFGLVAVVLAAIAFFLSPNAPLGAFWLPAPDMPMPSAWQLPLFILLNVAEVVTFGIGVAFLFFGLPLMRAIGPASLGLTRAAQVSIGWLLLNWWPHDSLHVHIGMALNGLLVIEYVFHITLMIAGVILAWFFLMLQRQTT